MALGMATALLLATFTCPTLDAVSAHLKHLKAVNWEEATSESVGASSLRVARPVGWDSEHRLAAIGWQSPGAEHGGSPCSAMYFFAQPQAVRADQLRQIHFEVGLAPRQSVDAAIDSLRRLVGQPGGAESFTEVCIDCGDSPPSVGYRWNEGRIQVKLLIIPTRRGSVSIRWSRKSQFQ